MDMFLLDGHSALVDITSRMIIINQNELFKTTDIDQVMKFLKIEKY